MSKHHTDEWFPDDQHGYSIGICRCDEGPYLGARKMGTPCRCERCGFMTQDQFDFLRDSIATNARREALERAAENATRPATRAWLRLLAQATPLPREDQP